MIETTFSMFPQPFFTGCNKKKIVKNEEWTHLEDDYMCNFAEIFMVNSCQYYEASDHLCLISPPLIFITNIIIQTQKHKRKYVMGFLSADKLRQILDYPACMMSLLLHSYNMEISRGLFKRYSTRHDMSYKSHKILKLDPCWVQSRVANTHMHTYTGYLICVCTQRTAGLSFRLFPERACRFTRLCTDAHAPPTYSDAPHNFPLCLPPWWLKPTTPPLSHLCIVYIPRTFLSHCFSSHSSSLSLAVSPLSHAPCRRRVLACSGLIAAYIGRIVLAVLWITSSINGRFL